MLHPMVALIMQQAGLEAPCWEQSDVENMLPGDCQHGMAQPLQPSLNESTTKTHKPNCMLLTIIQSHLLCMPSCGMASDSV